MLQLSLVGCGVDERCSYKQPRSQEQHSGWLVLWVWYVGVSSVMMFTGVDVARRVSVETSPPIYSSTPVKLEELPTISILTSRKEWPINRSDSICLL